LKDWRTIKKTLLIIPILLAMCSSLHSQSEDRNWKIGLNGILSTGYGNQGLTIPLWETKTFLGMQLRKNKNTIYSQIGFSGFLGPLYSLHLETGYKRNFLSIDHSINWHKVLRDPVIKYNHNFNLGIHIPLNAKKDNNLTLSIRGGKSIFTYGHTSEYPMIWDGYNMEVRIIVLLYES
jgi:hypothetical protein